MSNVCKSKIETLLQSRQTELKTLEVQVTSMRRLNRPAPQHILEAIHDLSLTIDGIELALGALGEPSQWQADLTNRRACDFFRVLDPCSRLEVFKSVGGRHWEWAHAQGDVDVARGGNCDTVKQAQESADRYAAKLQTANLRGKRF